jgi:hypothetical protein
MAKFIVKDKVYDTEKAVLLCEGDKQWEEYYIFFGRNLYPYRPTKLYKTLKGNYFFVFEKDYGSLHISVCTEQEAKDWLKYKNYDKYVEMFGELEEA